MSINYPDVYEKDEVKDIVEDRRIVRMVRDFMFRSREYRRPYLRLARRSRDAYECWQMQGRSMIQRANLKLPYGYTIIENQTPQIVDIFARHDYVMKFEGQEPSDYPWESLLSDFHKFQYREMDLKAKFPQVVKSLLLDGTVICKVPYIYTEMETVERVTEIGPDGLPESIKVPKTIVTYDGPGLEIIPIYDFFPDWSVRNAGDIQSMRGVVHRTYKTLASLKAVNNRGIRKIYKNLDQLEISVNEKGTGRAWAPPYWEEDNYKADFEERQDLERSKSGIKDEGRVEIWEYWGLYDPNNDGNFQEFLIVVANGDVVIRAEINFYDYKFKPFVATPNVARSNEFYGIPELSAPRALIKEATTIRNARLDNINLSVNPMWLAQRDAGIASKSLYSRPNGIVWTNDINGIKPLQLSDPSAGSAREIQEIQQDIQNSTTQLNSPAALGKLSSTFGRSATGVQFIQGITNSRVGLKAQHLSELFFKRLAQIMQMTNRQFVTEDQWVRVSNPDAPNPYEILPASAFFRKFDFIPKTDLETGGPEGEFQKISTVSQVLQVAEQSQPGTVRMDVLIEALLRPLLGSQVGAFTRTEEEREQMMQARLAQQQAINAEQGRAAPQPNANTLPPTGVPGGEV